MTNYNMNIKTIIELELGFEEYFVLKCLYYNDKNLLVDYVTKCKKINTDLFKELHSKGYILINTLDFTKIYYENLSLSEKGAEILQTTEASELLVHTADELKSGSNFESFRQLYPNRVKQASGYRNLHTDLKRCRKLYDKLCMETSHDILCKCAKLYIEDCQKSNTYIQNLATWLHQENYKNYLDDTSENNNKTNNFTNLEAI